MNRDAKRITITGGAGYIAQALRHYWWPNWTNYSKVLVEPASGMHQGYVDKVWGSFSSADNTQVLRSGNPYTSTANATDLILLGAHSRLRECDADPGLSIRQNVDSVVEYCDAIREQGKTLDTLIFASSCAVYSDNSANMKQETDNLNPAGAYGLSKRMCEQVIRMYQARYGIAKRAFILRLFNVAGGFYGMVHTPASRSRILPTIIRTARKGVTFQIHTPSTARDFVHVRDVASLIGALIDAPEDVEGGTVNVGRGRLISMGGLIEEVKVRLGPQANLNTEYVVKKHREADAVGADTDRLDKLLNRLGAPTVSDFQGLSAMISSELQYGEGLL